MDTEVTELRQLQSNIHLYAQQYWSGPNQNQHVVTKSSFRDSFGETAVMDWPLLDGPGSNAKVIGHLHGQDIRSEMSSRFVWYINFCLVFDDERYALKGSTLQVRGMWHPNSDTFEWAIIGGTGQFTLAQGIVYGKVHTRVSNGRKLELHIRVFYRPIMKPDRI